MAYTIESYINELRRRVEVLNNSSSAVAMAAATTLADQVERVFTDGEASDGSKIGNYDTKKELYVNPNDAPRKFQPKGKTGKTKFKSGKPHKTKYFESYKSFRENQSRPTSTVNLDLFGRLKSEYENSLKRGESGTWESSITTEENLNKALGAEKHFAKKIFALTKNEREKYSNVLRLELNHRLNNA